MKNIAGPDPERRGAANPMFHPVLKFPSPPLLLDFSPEGAGNPTGAPYTIGRYNENRAGHYQQDLFQRHARHYHVGIDLGAPAGTPLHAFTDGFVLHFADNAAPGDYGPTLVTQHRVDGKTLYVLWGHLSRKSLDGQFPGREIKAGEVFAWIGDETENGGWPPHAHVQLSWEKPAKADLPGVVSAAELSEALERYPDPRLILGPLY